MSSDFETWWADYGSGLIRHTNHDHEQHAERVAAHAWEHRDHREAMMRGEIATLKIENANLRAEVADLQSRLDAAWGDVSAMQGIVARLTAERDEANANARLYRDDRERLTAEVATLKAERDVARSCLSVVEEIAERYGEINKSLTAERDEARQNADALRKTLASAQSNEQTRSDPLAEMWRELAEYQPMADRDGHGESWARMCRERTESAAERAREALEVAPAETACDQWQAAMFARWSVAWQEHSRRNMKDTISAIKRAKEVQR